MSPFTDLPIELVREILFHSAPRALSSILCTCKWKPGLIEPFLYRDISWVWDPFSTHNNRLRLLLRSILNRPQLASYVKHLRFRGTKHSSIWRIPGRCELDPGELQLIVRAVTTTGSPLGDGWTMELILGNVDAYVALLLRQLSNLRSLELGASFQYCSGWLPSAWEPFLVSDPAAASPYFRLLHRVSLSGDVDPVEITDHYHGSDYAQTLPLFYLPNIKTLDLIINDRGSGKPDGPEAAALYWPNAPPCASTLTALILRYSSLCEDYLGTILSVTPNLRTLVYDNIVEKHPNDTTNLFRSPFFDGTRLGRALWHVAASLEYMYISVRFFPSTRTPYTYDDSHDDEEYAFKGRVSSLRCFKKLQNVCMPLVALLGWSSSLSPRIRDILPRRLRYLCFTDRLALIANYEWTEREVILKIRDYFEDLRSHSPDLERITISLAESSWRWKRKSVEDFAAMGKDAGVLCQVFREGIETIGKPRLILDA